MKKVNLSFLALVLPLTLLTFNSQSQSITLLTQPEKSRGFIAWDEASNASYYELHLLESTPNDSINEIALLTTDGQHVRIDPALMQIQNIGYVVTAHQTDGVIIDNSDTIWTDIPGNLGHELVYSKTCVGGTYAWKLNTWAKILSQTTNNQGEVVNNLGNMHLELTETGAYWDQASGNYTPYWQAFSGSAWTNLISNHPYKRVLGFSQQAYEGLWNYGYYDVINFNSNTAGGPYYDGDGY